VDGGGQFHGASGFENFLVGLESPPWNGPFREMLFELNTIWNHHHHSTSNHHQLIVICDCVSVLELQVVRRERLDNNHTI
jgi:hypothetical protein